MYFAGDGNFRIGGVEAKSRQKSIGMSIQKIAIIGPESTGKSTLCGQLADYFNTSWVPEYARTFLHQHGSAYNYDDLLSIAKGQVALEEKALSSVSPGSRVFIDTEMYVMKVWSEFVFDKCHSWILNKAAGSTYDMYFLCNIDLPWVKDELREYPEEAPRKELYNIYKNILLNQSTPWVEINGSYEERVLQAIKAVEKIRMSNQ